MPKRWEMLRLKELFVTLIYSHREGRLGVSAEKLFKDFCRAIYGQLSGRSRFVQRGQYSRNKNACGRNGAKSEKYRKTEKTPRSR